MLLMAMTTGLLTSVVAQTVEIPASFALPANSASLNAPGFKVRVVQADQAQVGFVALTASSARAEAQLAGVLLDPATGQPYRNVVDTTTFNQDGTYDEAGVIDYEQNGNATSGIPGIPGTTQSNDNIALEAVTYLTLTPGNYAMVVNSDDGFKVVAGPDARDWFKRITVGVFEGGRSAAYSVFRFSIAQAGVYSFRLLWYEADGGANVSWFSADPADPSKRVLINDAANAGAIKAYRALTESRPAFIRYVSPAPNQIGVVPTAVLEVQIGDGDAAQVDQNSVELYLNDVEVSTTPQKTGSLTRIEFDPPGLLPSGSTNKVRIVYRDTASMPNTRTEEYSFKVMNYVSITLPSPLYFENFDSTPEGSLPAAWSQVNFTDQSGSSADIDFGNLDSAAYATWTVVDAARFRGSFVTYSNPANPDSWENDYKRVLSFNPVNIVNGEIVRELAKGRFAFADSGYRNGQSQVMYLFSRDFDLSGKTNVFLSFHSLWEQNQDSMAAVEYSIDGGQTWLPIVYMINTPAVKKDANNNIDAVATLTTPYADVARYTDPDTGEEKGGNYGAFIGAAISQDLAPFISARVDDDPVGSKRVELFRLPRADNQSKVRFRFAHAGTDSWYFGIDDFGLYSITATNPPAITTAPQNATVVAGNPVTFTAVASGTPPLSYQWYRGSQVIAGATADSFSIEAVQSSDAGAYFVRVANAAGFADSAKATLTVTPRPPAVFAVWNFDDADLALSAGTGTLEYADGDVTKGLTGFATTDGVGVPHIGGQPAKFMRVPAFTDAANGYNLTMPMPPNGGGSYVNQYTIIWDVLLPTDIYWMPFFNTAPDNGNDADFYVSNTGGLGVAALGYAPDGTIQADTWYRIAFAANLAIGKVTYYLNGQPVFTRTGESLVDGRHSLSSQNDAGPDLRLFNEGDTSGDYTHEVLLNSLFFIDRTMTADEIKASGGPSASGIPAPSTSDVALSISLHETTNVTLAWQGGAGIKLQKTLSLSAPNWQDVPQTLGQSSAVEPITGSGAFYRLFKE